MKVKLSEAVKIFFSNSSLEMVFFEAISNSLDAEATKIDIDISIESFSQPETLTIEIKDNGVGFDNDRYKKFSNLFDVDENTHKGLGRLVYLCYFENIYVESVFNNTQKRTFNFSEQFDEKKYKLTTIAPTENGTILKMKQYILQKVAKKEYLDIKNIKKRILEEFYSRLFEYKQENKGIVINITLNDVTETLSDIDIPKFSFIELDITDVTKQLDLYNKLELYYSIEKTQDQRESSIISAISVDNRTFKIDLIAEENFPIGYKMVFLLFSEYFKGKIDVSRQNLTLSKTDIKKIEMIFREEVSSLIESRIPKVKKNNQEIKEKLVNIYPHLAGYFNSKNIGYIRRNEILKEAQDEFFRAQRELLEANDLDEEQFEKSLEMSSRALTEYILFRHLTINKLKNTTSENSEAEIHKMITLKGKEGRFEKANLIQDIYRNNSWLLDDKFMTYEYILSDREMTELLEILVEDEIEKNEDRPDMAFIFSNHPSEDKPFDVVIVELKKRGLTPYENMKTTYQLQDRARKLSKYYNNKVQRIWYYGIIEYNDETELGLRSNEYKELYSLGKLYYKENNIAISLSPEIKIPIGIFMWDIDGIIKDAEARNSTFLNFIKSKFIR